MFFLEGFSFLRHEGAKVDRLLARWAGEWRRGQAEAQNRHRANVWNAEFFRAETCSQETLTGELGTRGFVAPEVRNRTKHYWQCVLEIHLDTVNTRLMKTLEVQRCSPKDPMERNVPRLLAGFILVPAVHL